MGRFFTLGVASLKDRVGLYVKTDSKLGGPSWSDLFEHDH